MLLPAARVLGIALAHGLAFAVRASVQVDAPSSDVARLRGESLATALEALGPTYIKLGQLLSARPDVIGVELAAGLARLQERVRPLPSELARRALHEGLGPRAAAFADVDPAPLGSGSIAQVHRATLRDGRPVAVKIRRPDVVRRYAADARVMLGGAWMLARVGLSFPVRPWLVEFLDAVGAQLDLEREGASYRDLAGNLACVPGVRLPAVLPELTSASVLTMELLTDLHHVDDSRLDAADRTAAVRRGLDALFRMIFVDGLVHADLHPGNVFFRRGGECVLVDAGVVARLAPAVRRDFAAFFLGLVTDRGRDCARIVLDQATYRAPDLDREAFDADVEAIVHRFARLPARDFEVTAFAQALFAVQHHHRVYSAPDFMMAIVSLLGYEGIVKRVEPDLDFQAIALESLRRSFRDAPGTAC